MKKILKYMNFSSAARCNVAVRFTPRPEVTRHRWVGLILVIVVIFQSSLSLAEVPQLINYQGTLTESGVPVTGNRSMAFRIWNAFSGGTILWVESRTVAVNNGVFNIKLGERELIPASIFSGASTYLEIIVEMVSLGRERLVTVPYAYHAAVADSVSGSLIMTSPLRLQNTSLQFEDITWPAIVGKFDIVSASNTLMFRRMSTDWSTAKPLFDLTATDSMLVYGDFHAAQKAIIYKDLHAYQKAIVYSDLHVYGSAKFYSDKIGYATDIFRNTSDKPLEQGDLVRVSDGAITYYGKNKLIPVSGIAISDTVEDSRIIGIVCEKCPDNFLDSNPI